MVGTVLSALMIGLILMGLEFSQQVIIRGVMIILAIALVRRDA